MSGSMHPVQRATRLALALAAAACLWLSPPAWAQFGEAAGIAESMNPEYFRRDVTLIVQELDMDEAQSLIVQALFDDYNNEFDQGLERMKQRFRDMSSQWSTGDQQRLLRMVFSPWQDWSAERDLHGEQFLENVKVILNGDQLARWPSFRRRLFREKQMYKGQFDGENLDLFPVLRDMNLNPAIEAMIAPTVNAYEADLDQALRHREQVLRETQPEIIRAIQTQDPQGIMVVIDRQMTARLAVRDVNDQYVELIAASMPEEIGREFRQAALSKAYPRVYRALPIVRLFKAARELDVDPQVHRSIVDLEEAFHAEIEPLNRALLQAVRRYGPGAFRARTEASAARMTGEPPAQISKPEYPNFSPREQVCRQFAAMLRNLLTEEVFETLPGAERWMQRKPTPRPGGGRNRGGEGGVSGVGAAGAPVKKPRGPAGGAGGLDGGSPKPPKPKEKGEAAPGKPGKLNEGGGSRSLG